MRIKASSRELMSRKCYTWKKYETNLMNNL